MNNSELVNEKQSYPNLGQAWTLFGIFLLSTLLLSGIQAGFSALCNYFGISIKNLNDWFLVINYVVSFSLTLLYAKSIALSDGITIKLDLGKVPPLVFFLLLLITPALSIIVEYWVSFIPMPDVVQKMFADAFKFNGFTFIAAVIAAPILEEVLCRGIIFKGLLQHFSPVKAMVHSALIFAVLHMNPWQAIPAFILGMLMAWVYYKTKSLWPTIFIHLVNNGLSFIMLGIDEDAVSGKDFWGDSYWIVLLVSAFVFIVTIYCLYHVLNKNRFNDV